MQRCVWCDKVVEPGGIEPPSYTEHHRTSNMLIRPFGEEPFPGAKFPSPSTTPRSAARRLFLPDCFPTGDGRSAGRWCFRRPRQDPLYGSSCGCGQARQYFCQLLLRPAFYEANRSTSACYSVMSQYSRNHCGPENAGCLLSGCHGAWCFSGPSAHRLISGQNLPGRHAVPGLSAFADGAAKLIRRARTSDLAARPQNGKEKPHRRACIDGACEARFYADTGQGR